MVSFATINEVMVQLPGLEGPELTLAERLGQAWQDAGGMAWLLALCVLVGFVVIVWKFFDLMAKSGSTRKTVAQAVRLMPRQRNRLLLMCPVLYRLRFVRYESNLEEIGLRELYELADRVASLPGVIIECGSSRLGSAILLARHLERRGRLRPIFALDSFAGFRRDELDRERALGLTEASDDAFTSTSFEYVVAKLRKLKLADTIFPVEGFFEDTLPAVADREVALAFVDCDLGDSLRFCAETIWPRLASGGIMAFDDYTAWIVGEKRPSLEFFLGVKPAVDAFVADNLENIADHGLMRRLYYVKKR